MSIKIMSMVWDEGPADPTECFVLLALADIADENGVCWPSVKTVADRSRMSERNARRIIRKLEEAGWLSTELQPGRNKSNLYTITKPDTAMSARTNCPPGQMKHENRTNEARKPDTAMSAEPSVTIKEPSVEYPPCIPPAEKPPPKARLPADWALSDEGWAYARSQGIPEKVIEDEARGFHAYWTDRTDREARKSERGWEQCWAGWCRRIAGRYSKGSPLPFGANNQRGQRGGNIASIAARRRAAGEL